jgi:hypothetical protein
MKFPRRGRNLVVASFRQDETVARTSGLFNDFAYRSSVFDGDKFRSSYFPLQNWMKLNPPAQRAT